MTDIRPLLLTDSDVFAGTERHILDLAAALRHFGVSPLIGCPDPGALAQRAHEEKFTVVPIAKKGVVDFAAARIISELLRSGKINLVHAHNGRTHIAAALAISRAGRGKLVATQHFLTPSRAMRRGLKALVPNFLHRWADRHTSATIAISDAVRHAALMRHDTAPEKIITIHNGIRASQAESTSSVAAVRHALGISPNQVMIFCAARLEKEKDIPSLVHAMTKIHEQFPGAICLIAGQGQEKDAIDSLLRSQHADRYVRLLGFRQDVAALMHACDIFVLPALAEPFGLVVVEAMAAAKPVVVTDAGGPPEIIENGRSGLLVPPESPGQLADALITLAADSSLRAAMGSAAHQRYSVQFTADRMAQDVLSLYQRVTG